jgi:hypothetical protein
MQATGKEASANSTCFSYLTGKGFQASVTWKKIFMVNNLGETVSSQRVSVASYS